MMADSFVDEEGRAGYEKHGPAAAAGFERLVYREARILRQRHIAGVMNELLQEINQRAELTANALN